MKTKFRILVVLFLLMYSCSEQHSDGLRYTLSLSENKDRIDVHMTYESKSRIDTINILIPTSYDRFQMKNSETIDRVELLSKGSILKIAPDKYRIVTDRRSFQLSYSIPSLSKDTRQISCVGDEHFIPHVNEKFFHFFGDKGLVIPDYDEKKESVFDLEFKWENFPESWHIANDFGIAEKEKVQTKRQVLLNNIGNTLFFGGDYRKKTLTIDDKKLHVYLYGKWKFEDEVFLSAIENIARVEFDLWKHFYHSSNYVISLTQKGTDDCGRMTGRNMLDSFSFYLPGKFSREHVPFFYPQLVHEFTHSWIGVDVIANSTQPATMKWFTEGFTEYYTLKISKKTGFYNDDQYLDNLNEHIKKYMISPFRSLNITEYNEGYIYDERLENLAYNKGAVFAFYLDGYIREQTANRFNLDHFMDALFEEESMRKMKSNLTNDFIINIAKEKLGVDISELVDRYIVKGEIIPIASPLIMNLKTEMQLSFDYGFNYVKSIEREIITEVNENSNAFNAGLRSGQKFLGIKQVTNKPNGKMILVVSDGENSKQVEFSPKGTVITIPVIEKIKM